MKTNNKKTTKQTTNKKTNKTKVVNKKIDNVLPISNKENRLTNKEKENEVKSLKRTRAGIIKSKKFEYKAMVKAKALRPDRKAIRDEYKRIHVNGESTMSDPSNIIEIRNLRKIFFTKGNFEKVLNGVDLDVKRGEIAVILGASGGGKTTLLNIVSGLIQPTSGSVKVVDKNLF
ncbi:MAG: hypothetical protein DRP42_03560 [Tenericutes bacterium]|nr:MAG: hypothetical protein DRP42_03560 [Mycoplasmatota bacterium]